MFWLPVGLRPQAASLEMPSGVEEGKLEELVPVALVASPLTLRPHRIGVAGLPGRSCRSSLGRT